MRTLVLSLLSLPLLAADLQVNDIRLEIGRGTASSFDGEIRYKEGGNSMFATQTVTDDEWTGSDPVAVAILYSRARLAPFGFLWAAGAEYQSSDDDIGGDSYRTSLIGAKVRAGLGWCPSENWRLEATGELHLGYITSEDADVTSNGDLDRADATGGYQAIGLQIGGGYAFKSKWEVGVSLRSMFYSAQLDADFDQTGGSYEADYSWMFWSAAVTGGYRF